MEPGKNTTQFIKEYGIIDVSIQDKIIAQVRQHVNNSELQPSQLYSSSLDAKFVDPEKRSSKYKSIIDASLFATVDELVSKLNELDKYYNYVLVKNDVTYIKYETGDFFKSHEDYLSFTSNVIEEFTLIMCIDAVNCQGGRTIFRVNEFFTHKSTDSITPKHCLLFRKDLQHEGELLTAGTKEILTLNLLGIAKTCPAIIAIEFTNDTRKYLISEDKIRSCGDNLLAAFLNFNSGKKILIYTEKNYTFEEFTVVYHIFNRSYISVNDYKKNKAIIDYYQIDINNILLAEFNKPAKSATQNFLFTQDIIINETEEQTRYMSLLAKENNLPYISFKMVFVEGTLTYGGGMSDCEPTQLEMTPAWLSIGECNNIVFYKGLTNKNGDDNNMSLDKILDYKKEEMDKLTKYISNFNKPVIKIEMHYRNDMRTAEYKNGVYSVKIDPDIYYGLTCINYGLRVYKPSIDDAAIMKMVESPDPIEETVNVAQESDIADSNDYYSFNHNGNTILFDDQCKTVMDVVKKSDLEKTIKSKLNEINFTLPQNKIIIQENFCNESVYGKCTVLFVTGLIKIPATKPNYAEKKLATRKDLAIYILNGMRGRYSEQDYNAIIAYINAIDDVDKLDTVIRIINTCFVTSEVLNIDTIENKIKIYNEQQEFIDKIFSKNKK